MAARIDRLYAQLAFASMDIARGREYASTLAYEEDELLAPLGHSAILA